MYSSCSASVFFCFPISALCLTSFVYLMCFCFSAAIASVFVSQIRLYSPLFEECFICVLCVSVSIFLVNVWTGGGGGWQLFDVVLILLILPFSLWVSRKSFLCFALSFRRVHWAVLISDLMRYRVFSMFITKRDERKEVWMSICVSECTYVCVCVCKCWKGECV